MMPPIAARLDEREQRALHEIQPDARRAPSPSTIALSAVVIHLAAAAVLYHLLVRQLYALFDATPRLLVMEQGIARLTAAVAFLPPVVPTALIALTTLWVGSSRRDARVSRWLALAMLPLAFDGVLRTFGSLLAPAPTSVGELLDLPARFSPGPRLVVELLNARPSPATMYWLVVCSAAAAAVVCCVGRALLAAEESALESAARRRRSRSVDSLAALQYTLVAVVGFLALAFLGQLALPPATQLFLRVLG